MNFFKRKGPNNEEVSLSPWTKPTENDPNAPPVGTQQQQQQPPTNAPDPRKAVLDAMRKNGLYEGLEIADFMNAVQKQDLDAAGQFFSKVMENAALVSLQMADQIAETKVRKATESAVDTATKQTKRQLMIDEMHAALGFTSEEALKPVAEQALEGFLAQGMEPKKAIEAVGEFFKATAQTAGTHFGMRMEERGGNGLPRTDFRSARTGPQNNQNNNDDEEPDWVSLFTHGTQTHDAPADSGTDNA